jgi:hypothetical protein
VLAGGQYGFKKYVSFLNATQYENVLYNKPVAFQLEKQQQDRQCTRTYDVTLKHFRESLLP